MIVLSSLSFGRDYEHEPLRDTVKFCNLFPFTSASKISKTNLLLPETSILPIASSYWYQLTFNTHNNEPGLHYVGYNTWLE